MTHLYEYRLVIHKLSSPKCFIDYLHNYQYSFLWKSSCDSYSISTDEYIFNKKTCNINFNKTKLKLRLNQFVNNNNNNNNNNDDEKQSSQSSKFTSTKLILCEHKINGEIINLDEITLTTNYFVINKKQATNITFNKIIANDIRIELKLNVTLIAKTIKKYNISHSSSIGRNSFSGDSMSDHNYDKKQKEEILLKLINDNINNNINYDSSTSFGGYQSSVCSENIKKRRSGLSANSVGGFYKKSKEIEIQNKEENKIIDEQIKNEYNEMGNQLMINIEEVKHLKSQIQILQNLLYEKNIEIDQLKDINIEQKKKISKLENENKEYKMFNNKYKIEFGENKILMQTMKYQLQSRYSKYNQLLNATKLNKKNKLKAYIASLIIDNDDLENEINRIADSWRNTSNLMENYSKKKTKKLIKLNKLYKQSLKQNQILTNKLIKHGIINKEDTSTDDDDDDEQDIDDIVNNDNHNHNESDDDDEMNELWNDMSN